MGIPEPCASRPLGARLDYGPSPHNHQSRECPGDLKASLQAARYAPIAVVDAALCHQGPDHSTAVVKAENFQQSHPVVRSC